MRKPLYQQDAQTCNQTIFDAIAPHYDRMNKIISLGMEQGWKRRAVRCLAPLDEPCLILDLCGGTGDLAKLALRACGRGQYIVFDMNAAMLKAGEDKLPPAWRGQVTYMQGDALRLPFAANSLDKVMLCFGLRNVPDMQSCLNEIARALKPGGQLVCLEFAVPDKALLRWSYRLYMAMFVRLVLTLTSGRQDAYRYLSASINSFAVPDKVWQAITNAGMQKHQCLKLFCGVGYIYDAVKS